MFPLPSQSDHADHAAAAVAVEAALATLTHLSLNLEDEGLLTSSRAVEVLRDRVEEVRDDLRAVELRPPV